jgi:hypothetical protein
MGTQGAQTTHFGELSGELRGSLPSDLHASLGNLTIGKKELCIFNVEKLLLHNHEKIRCLCATYQCLGGEFQIEKKTCHWHANGSYSVTYDDGDKEAKVLLKHIYKLNVRMLDADPAI